VTVPDSLDGLIERTEDAVTVRCAVCSVEAVAWVFKASVSQQVTASIRQSEMAWRWLELPARWTVLLPVLMLDNHALHCRCPEHGFAKPKPPTRTRKRKAEKP